MEPLSTELEVQHMQNPKKFHWKYGNFGTLKIARGKAPRRMKQKELLMVFVSPIGLTICLQKRPNRNGFLVENIFRISNPLFKVILGTQIYMMGPMKRFDLWHFLITYRYEITWIFLDFSIKLSKIWGFSICSWK